MTDKSLSGILLVTDLDGTLVTDKGLIPQRNYDAIDRFMGRGGRVAFATGRSVIGCEKFAARITLNAPAIVYNGGGLYDFSQQKLLCSVFLPKNYDEIIRVVKEDFPDVGIEIYSGGRIFYVNKNSYTREHVAFQGVSAIDRDLDDMPAECSKILFCGDKDRLLEVSERLEANKNDGCAYVFSGPGYYEVLPAGVSKGMAVRLLADVIGVGYDKIMSIGDYYNDLEMLAVSAFSAAPEGAPDDVKCVADIVVCPCEDGAVAEFIEHIEERFG
jgi:Cof subfamily protein (haloacid dehalogenase superfamily)